MGNSPCKIYLYWALAHPVVGPPLSGIRSDVITLGFIEMYGLVTVWTNMDDGPYWVILLMYESRNMRHTGFCRLTVVNGTPEFLGVTPNPKIRVTTHSWLVRWKP